jgi:hypothetical protein
MAWSARNQSRSKDILKAEGPYVEQFYPRQMSWYAAEGPQGRIEDLGRWIRENPWKAMAAGAIIGLAVSQTVGPASRAARRVVRSVGVGRRAQGRET